MSGLKEQKDLWNLNNYISNRIDVGNTDETESEFLGEQVTAEELQKFSNTLKAEIVFARNSFGTDTYTGKGDMLTTKQIWNIDEYKKQCQDLRKEDLWYINKEVAGKEKQYIYDKASEICFKIPDTKIGSNVYHSLEYAKFYIDGENSAGIGIVDTETGIMTSSDETKCYEPDLNKFSYKTEIVYYSSNLQEQITMSVKEYLEKGKPKTIEYEGQTYTFADYVADDSTKIWANIRCTANSLESYWTWIPRFAYKLNSSSATSDIIFVDINDKPIDTEKYTENLPSGYTVHEAFKQKDGLKGIWFSKYQPSVIEMGKKDNVEPQTPDLSNFSSNDTKLIYYTQDAKESIEVDYTENPSQTIQLDGKTYYFYNYENKIWANIKCQANGVVSYWTWIPRYAYQLESGTTNVILVDENDKPLNSSVYGDSLPAGYTVHEAFKQGDGLKGIWFSKYQPSKLE